MNRLRHVFLKSSVGLWLVVAFVCPTITSGAEPMPADAARVEFFEKKVRPILAQHCYACHSHVGGKIRGGLSLDSRSGWEKGGDSGPAVLPGSPDKSLLIQAVRHAQPDLKMPPKDKLNDAEIAILVDWVRQGAPDPRVLAKATNPAGWWSLKPLVSPQIPAKSTGHPIDAFVQRQLTAKHLTSSPEADRRTLIRRLTFDLHGLPPIYEDVKAFVASRDPLAYEKLVDRLLASPRYGERWARHWLDVVRYGDSRGNEHDGFREHAWRYRDYVIDAVNRDKPYDRFIQEQIAADAMFPEDASLTAALGFLAAGPDVLSGSEDTVRNEFVTTAMSAFTSTTVHCAHCHNHKFDPISQDDYYAVQSIFAGVQRRDVPVDLDPAIRATRTKWMALKAAATGKGDKNGLLTSETKAIVANWEKYLAEKSPQWRPLPVKSAIAASGIVLEQDQDGSILAAKAPATETDTYTLTIPGPINDARMVRLEILPTAKLQQAFSLSEFEILQFASANDKARKVGFKSAQSDAASKDQPIARVFDGKDDTGWDGGSRSGKSAVAIFELNGSVKIPDGGRLEIVLKQLQAKKQIGRFRLAVTDQAISPYALVPAVAGDALIVPAAQRSENDWLALAAHALPIMSDEGIKSLPTPTSFHVVAGVLPHEGKPSSAKQVTFLKRGGKGKTTIVATPGALSCVSDLNARMDPAEAKEESARRAYLARWLSDRNNPLTWRSIVNRMWHHHFGRGIVDTPSDFGQMGGLPSHPELLDWLACEFRDNGMSFKKLHRLIVTSATYRQAVATNGGAEKIDLDNRLLWRMNRNRLDAESFRDTVLAVSGRLDLATGGPGVLQFEV
ncbi:MAG: PSD1 and planctomycete cytochrome C domain-containing protein, partial [Planctomycetota bacterium]